MLIKIAPRNPLLPSEITSEGPYAERRRFPKAMGLAAGAASAASSCCRLLLLPVLSLPLKCCPQK